jgi:hypothetical protein
MRLLPPSSKKFLMRFLAEAPPFLPPDPLTEPPPLWGLPSGLAPAKRRSRTTAGNTWRGGCDGVDELDVVALNKEYQESVQFP